MASQVQRWALFYSRPWRASVCPISGISGLCRFFPILSVSALLRLRETCVSIIVWGSNHQANDFFEGAGIVNIFAIFEMCH